MAEYLDAPEVETVAQNVLSHHWQRGMLTDCEGANIKYLFKSAEKSKHWGVCYRAVGKWKFLTDYDFVIEIWREAWDTLSALQKEALLYHELRHVKKKLVQKDNETVVKWSTYDHELQFFYDEITAYGLWNKGLEDLYEEICIAVGKEGAEHGQVTVGHVGADEGAE